MLTIDGEGVLPAQTNLSGAACYCPSQRNLNPSLIPVQCAAMEMCSPFSLRRDLRKSKMLIAGPAAVLPVVESPVLCGWVDVWDHTTEEQGLEVICGYERHFSKKFSCKSRFFFV